MSDSVTAIVPIGDNEPAAPLCDWCGSAPATAENEDDDLARVCNDCWHDADERTTDA